MKNSIIGMFVLALTSMNLVAQSGGPLAGPSQASGTTLSAPAAYQVVDNGPNYTVWQRFTYDKGPNGQIMPQVHKYTELATGLNHLVKGQWVTSQENIHILPDGTAAATDGQHQAYFPGDIYNGTIRMVTPDGKMLQSRPIGMSYDDGTNTLMIAELTNSIGYLVGSNQVVYPNAFTGFKADLRYTYTKSGFEQDVILRQQPPTPESLGLNADTAKLQVLTEFFSPPQPNICSRKLKKQAGLYLDDESLEFGQMQMGQGRAFLLGRQATDAGALVGKQWVQMEGRNVLVEAVPVDAIVEGLAALPLTAMNAAPGQAAHLASRKLALPTQRLARKVPGAHLMQMAQGPQPVEGLVMDYQTLNSSLTNFTFQGDATYYISGNTYTYGATFEGGTVLKYAVNASLLLYTTSNFWKASSYQPVTFTAKDDNSIGDTISGSTGTPTGYYASSAIGFGGSQSIFGFSHFRMAFENVGIFWLTSGGVTPTYSDAQFLNCNCGINGGDGLYGTTFLRNVLFSGGNCPFNVQSGSVDVQNSTFVQVSNLVTGSGATLAITNCLIANVANISTSGFTLNADHNGFYNSGGGSSFGTAVITIPSYPFQTVGGADYYLTNGTVCRGAGTRNIDPILLADLKQKTTWPPIVYDGISFTNNLVLGPQAPRETNSTLDLGYHYDPMDYVFGGCDLYSNLTFTAGTAVGWIEDFGGINPGGQPYSFTLNDGANLYLNGTATQPCEFVWRIMVQESLNGNWNTYGWMAPIVFNGSGAAPVPQLSASFTKWLADNTVPEIRDNLNYGVGRFNNCEFYNGTFASYAPSFYFTNCLLFRDFSVYWDQTAAASFTYQNCTFYNGVLAFSRVAGQPASFWTVKNTTFDGTAFSWTDNYGGNTNYTAFDYNAYNTNNLSWQTYPYPYPPTYGTLEGVVGAHDQMVSGLNWQTSWFGNFYLPPGSPLIDVGSTTADQVGLYQFTTQTNQVKETNSIVDIGYHYVAVDTNTGLPYSAYTIGVPDYLADSDGDGLPDWWEIQNFGHLEVNLFADPDGDGLNNLQEYQQGTDPNNSDSDYDGRSDGQEVLLDGTSPTNSSSFTNVMMGHWRFDNSVTWVGDGGQIPMVVSNLIAVLGVSTNAVMIDSNGPVILKYHDVESSLPKAPSNINCRNGSVVFWFKPDWNSTNAGGVGPQSEARLIELGTINTTNGWWGLIIGTAGTNIYFGTQTNSTSTLTTNLNAAISWTSNVWHQIILTYASTNSSLYIDGQPVITNGLGTTYYPSLAVRSNGFNIGSSGSGTNQAQGEFDELETFNYPLPSAVAMVFDSDGNGLPDWWEVKYFGHLGVDPNADPDGEGLSNLQEYKYGLNPGSADTDGDGMNDALEIELGRNPLVKESNYIWFAPQQ